MHQKSSSLDAINFRDLHGATLITSTSNVGVLCAEGGKYVRKAGKRVRKKYNKVLSLSTEP